MKKRLVYENSSFQIILKRWTSNFINKFSKNLQIIALFILQNYNKGKTVKYSNIVHEID